MNIEEKLNMTMLCDFYELTMGNGYFENGFKDKITYFDVFFRSVPDRGGFALAGSVSVQAVPRQPPIYAALAPRIAASLPCARREPNSRTTLPFAARQTRFAFVAIRL